MIGLNSQLCFVNSQDGDLISSFFKYWISEEKTSFLTKYAVFKLCSKTALHISAFLCPQLCAVMLPLALCRCI